MKLKTIKSSTLIATYVQNSAHFNFIWWLVWHTWNIATVKMLIIFHGMSSAFLYRQFEWMEMIEVVANFGVRLITIYTRLISKTYIMLAEHLISIASKTHKILKIWNKIVCCVDCGCGCALRYRSGVYSIHIYLDRNRIAVKRFGSTLTHIFHNLSVRMWSRST